MVVSLLYLRTGYAIAMINRRLVTPKNPLTTGIVRGFGAYMHDIFVNYIITPYWIGMQNSILSSYFKIIMFHNYIIIIIIKKLEDIYDYTYKKIGLLVSKRCYTST